MLLYLFSALLIAGAFKTVMEENPAYSALYLALSMALLAGLFYLLGEPFLAGLQLLIYAGAVMVLFVMVLMLFNFKKEQKAPLKSSLKWILPVFLFGTFSGLISLMAFSSLPVSLKDPIEKTGAGESVTALIFTKHALIFEMLGIALLLIAIGVVAIHRIEGQEEEDMAAEDQTKTTGDEKDVI